MELWAGAAINAPDMMAGRCICIRRKVLRLGNELDRIRYTVQRAERPSERRCRRCRAGCLDVLELLVGEVTDVDALFLLPGGASVMPVWDRRMVRASPDAAFQNSATLADGFLLDLDFLATRTPELIVTVR